MMTLGGIQYEITANILTGNNNAAKEVPFASRRVKCKKIINAGTITTPPPIPNIPAMIPANTPIIKRPTVCNILLLFID